MKKPSLVVVDDFLSPELANRARSEALGAHYEDSSKWYKGRRSKQQYLDMVKPETFEELLGIRIPNWGAHGMNARFQSCVASDPIVYHTDHQQWAGALYLTPDAPLETGTSFYRSRKTGQRRAPASRDELDKMFGGFYDSTLFDKVDEVGNLFNRLVLWDAQLVHSATAYCGQQVADSRLFMVFFFDGD